MGIQELTDYIIIIGAIVVAITNIVNFLSQPGKFFKKKKRQHEEETKKQLVDSLKETLPQLLLKHDLETRDRYKADRERYLQEIKKEVLEENREILEDIREKSLQIENQIAIMNQSAKDVLRQKIMAIYHKNKVERRMSIYDKESLDELYKDYKAQHGNSYIDKYYNRMIQWEINEEDQEEENI